MNEPQRDGSADETILRGAAQWPQDLKIWRRNFKFIAIAYGHPPRKTSMRIAKGTISQKVYGFTGVFQEKGGPLQSVELDWYSKPKGALRPDKKPFLHRVSK